jgi:hypothetical protein
VTTLSFGRPAQSVAVFACPLSPVAGLLREPHLLPVQPIRQWHRRSATPSTIQAPDVGTGGASVKNVDAGMPLEGLCPR